MPSIPLDPSLPLKIPRQEAFCQNLMAGMTQAEAYTNASYANNKSVAQTACKFAKQRQIAARMAYLKQAAAQKTVSASSNNIVAMWDLSSIIIKEGVAAGKFVSAVSMMKYQMKCAGLENPEFTARHIFGVETIEQHTSRPDRTHQSSRFVAFLDKKLREHSSSDEE